VEEDIYMTFFTIIEVNKNIGVGGTLAIVFY